MNYRHTFTSIYTQFPHIQVRTPTLTHTYYQAHSHTLYIYNLCTLKKTSSILYISFIFFCMNPAILGGVMAETCFFLLLLFCAMQFILPLEAVTKFNLHSESCFAH